MNWNRLSGLPFENLSAGSSHNVETGVDRSDNPQQMDIIVIRKQAGTFMGRLPDGLENLKDYNLLSFKSHHQTPDAWTVQELIGQYVNYRKQVSPSLDQLLPEDQFGLYVICARFPEQLATQILLQERQAGVYDCVWGTILIRFVVIQQLPLQEHNALLLLFSAAPTQVMYAREHYQKHSSQTSSLISQVLGQYLVEGATMPYTMEDLNRD